MTAPVENRTRARSGWLALALVGLVIAASARSAAADWPLPGTPLAGGLYDQENPLLATDGAGGAFVCWVVGSGPPKIIRVVRLLHSGDVAPGWSAGGVTVREAVAGSDVPAMTSDGIGGVFVVWRDQRNDSTASGNIDLYAQHVLGDGTIAPGWPADGLPVCTAPQRQAEQQLVSDGAGGMIAVWTDLRDDPTNSYNSALYAQRIHGDGARAEGWPENGVLVAPAGGNPRVAADGAGGLLVAWEWVTVGYSEDIYAQRVLPTGQIAAGWPVVGAKVCGNTGDQVFPLVVADGQGGGLFCWIDAPVTWTHFHGYAQRLTAEGAIAPGWPTAGLSLSNSFAMQADQTIASDGAGGAIVVWSDERLGLNNTDLYAQRVTAAGQIAWAAGGAPVCSQASRQENPIAVPDGHGGALVAWQDDRFGSYPIYQQHLLANGQVDSPGGLDGTRVYEAEYGGIPTMIPDGYGGAAVAWHSNGSWGDLDVFVAHTPRITAETAVEPLRAPSFSLDRVSPNPVRDLFHVSFALVDARPATLEVLDLAGRRIDSREVGGFGAGRRSVAFDARALSPGIYLVRLRQGTYSEVKRISVMR